MFKGRLKNSFWMVIAPLILRLEQVDMDIVREVGRGRLKYCKNSFSTLID
jgi:hypothetical protein